MDFVQAPPSTRVSVVQVLRALRAQSQVDLAGAPGGAVD
jgi:hypothetical protein